MKAVRFPFDDFDLIIHPLQDSGMKGVFAMVQDSITIMIQHLGKLGDRSLPKGSSESAPLIQSLLGPGPGSIGPDLFELIFEDHDGVNHLVELQKFL